MKRLFSLIFVSFVLFPAFGYEWFNLSKIVAHNESDIFSVDFENYETISSDSPIGVFDSGIGGLTVLNEILQLDEYDNKTHQPGADGLADFEQERFIYLGDQANMPYGNYPSEGKTDFLRELVLKDAIFLLGTRYWPTGSSSDPRFDKPPVKAIVIACNTATAYGIQDIVKAVAHWKIPISVIGVVNAGAKGAMSEDSADGAVAVMATVGTCSSQGYVRAVDTIAKRMDRKAPPVVQQGCLGLAGAIEGDKSYINTSNKDDYRGPSVNNDQAPIVPNLMDRYGFDKEGLLGTEDGIVNIRLNSVENYIRYHALSLVESYKQNGGTAPIQSVILGCTHFPFYHELFEEAFDYLREYKTPEGEAPYAPLLAEQIHLIDPAQLTAMELFSSLAGKKLLLKPGNKKKVTTDQFYISIPNRTLKEIDLTDTGSFTYNYKYGRTPGKYKLEYVKRVPMLKANIGESAAMMIQTKMPDIWQRMMQFNQELPKYK